MLRALALKPVQLSRSFMFQKHTVIRSLSSTSAESYTEKQAKLGRPVSPHVTIYRYDNHRYPSISSFCQLFIVDNLFFHCSCSRFPMAAITSIMNRITGVALSVGVTGIGALALVGADVPSVMSSIGSITVIGTVAKFSVGFPLIYHYLGGVRHLIWDKMPEATLTNEDVSKASYALLGSATALSVILAFVRI